MTTTIKQQNVLLRVWNQFTQIAAGIDYDSPNQVWTFCEIEPAVDWLTSEPIPSLS